MEFHKYQEIENHYINKFIESIRLAGYDRTCIEWCALEKIHGANFTILCDGTNIEYARRKSKLIKNEDFYNHKSVVTKYEQNILDLFKLIKDKYNKTIYIQVHGEIFGGLYDHPDIPKVKESIKIQKGICYAPFNDYLIFDIVYFTNNDEKHYLNQYELIDMCENACVGYIPILYKGTFDDMLNLNPEYESTIYQRYGLPKIENNTAEGYVIKPIYPLLEIKPHQRIIIKLKADKFADRKVIDTNKQKPIYNITEEDQTLVNIIMNYVTEARISSVKSKYDYEHMKKNKFYGLIVKDIFDDVNKEYNISQDLKKMVTPMIIKELINMMYE